MLFWFFTWIDAWKRLRWMPLTWEKRRELTRVAILCKRVFRKQIGAQPAPYPKIENLPPLTVCERINVEQCNWHSQWETHKRIADQQGQIARGNQSKISKTINSAANNLQNDRLQFVEARSAVILLRHSRLCTKNEYTQWLLKNLYQPLTVKDYDVSGPIYKTETQWLNARKNAGYECTLPLTTKEGSVEKYFPSRYLDYFDCKQRVWI